MRPLQADIDVNQTLRDWDVYCRKKANQSANTHPGHDDDDMYQLARIAVWKATQDYDPERGDLTALIVTRIRQAMLREYSVLAGCHRVKVCRVGGKQRTWKQVNDAIKSINPALEGEYSRVAKLLGMRRQDLLTHIRSGASVYRDVRLDDTTHGSSPANAIGHDPYPSLDRQRLTEQRIAQLACCPTVLRILKGQSAEDIAAAKGVSVANVYARIKRERQRFVDTISTCPTCHKAFKAIAVGQVYCSSKHKPKTVKHCPCGKALNSRYNSRYCDRKCRKELR